MNPKVRVIAFDPVPHIHRRLEEQIALNGLGDRCQARCEAVSNVLGSVRFHVPHGELPTSASLHAMGFRGVEGSLIDVPVTMIDEVCSDDDHVDLVKIDVEGFEDKVLEGMQRVLAESAPALIVECNPDGPYTAVEAILTRFGYRFFHIRDEGPVQVERIIPDGQERYRNFLCIARDYQGGFE